MKLNSIVAQIMAAFGLLVLMLIIVSLIGLNTQNKMSGGLNVAADTIAPLLEESGQLTASAQTAVKAVAMHATTDSYTSFEHYEKEFENAKRNYFQSLTAIKQLLDSRPELISILTEADEAFEKVFSLSESHLPIQRQLTDKKALEYKAVNEFQTKWQYFEPALKDINFLITDKERPSAWLLASLSRDAIEAANLISEIVGKNTNDFERLLKPLNYHYNNVLKKQNILIDSAPVIASKIEPYVAVLSTHVNGDGVVSLRSAGLKLAAQSDTIKNDLQGALVHAMDKLENLNYSVSGVAEKLNKESETLSQQSFNTTVIALIASVLAAISIAYFLTTRIRKQMSYLIRDIKTVANGDFVHSGFKNIKGGEFGIIARSLDDLVTALSAMIKKVKVQSGHLTEMSSSNLHTIEISCNSISEQTLQTENLASAITEMDVSIHEVANNATSTASLVVDIHDSAKQNIAVLKENVADVQALKSSMNQAAQEMQELRDESSNIGEIVSVIRGIAEQTNLLALNAAIESARAGEQGRGFAVVADEVRTLASKTQQSTVEISEMVSSLQARAKNANDLMSQNQQKAEHCAEQAGLTADALVNMLNGLTKISDMSAIIATAVEEQSSVAAELSRSVTKIKTSAEVVLGNVKELEQASDQTYAMAKEQNELAANFKV
ncbi:methyl-accepting chemotaxis protein [Catenovulum sediminis]|uniref:Methyl-accepting chemotaxis protein n=1 Tax=Catenovulum sediminis TaxID=1740262 RepID=A0ABV1RCB9_9ALTE